MNTKEYQIEVEEFMNKLKIEAELRPIDFILKRNKLVEKGITLFRESEIYKTEEIMHILVKLEINPVILELLAEEIFFKIKPKERPGMII